MGVNNSTRGRTFHFDNTVLVEVTSALEGEEQRLCGLFASEETESKIGDFGGSEKYQISESVQDTNSSKKLI